MIDFYTYATPNGRKVAIMLEECGLAYRTHAVDLTKGEQKKPDFIKINPNGRVPAIVDHEPSHHTLGKASNSSPLAVFESGAIMIYLAEKTGKFFPTNDIRARAKCLGWVMWQMGGLGPMGGQLYHFAKAAPEDIPYAKKRYFDEVDRLLSVLEIGLQDSPYLVGQEYTIADMINFPWVVAATTMGLDLGKYPKLTAWHDKIAARPAVIKGMKSPGN